MMLCRVMQVGNHVSAARVLQLMRSAGLAPSVQAYTSYMDACVKANTPTSLATAFQVLRPADCVFLSTLPCGSFLQANCP